MPDNSLHPPLTDPALAALLDGVATCSTGVRSWRPGPRRVGRPHLGGTGRSLTKVYAHRWSLDAKVGDACSSRAARFQQVSPRRTRDQEATLGVSHSIARRSRAEPARRTGAAAAIFAARFAAA